MGSILIATMFFVVLLVRVIKMYPVIEIAAHTYIKNYAFFKRIELSEWTNTIDWKARMSTLIYSK